MSGNEQSAGQRDSADGRAADPTSSAGRTPGRRSPEGTRVLPVSNLGVPDRSDAIEVVHHESARFYELLDGGVSVALLVYEQDPRSTAITHAMVREDQRGRGLGTTLIATVLPHLAASGGRIANYCNSVARFLEKHPDFRSFVGSGG